MARPKLGSDATDGATAKFEVRIPAALRSAAEATLDGEKKETLSAFVREAMEREVKRRVRKNMKTKFVVMRKGKFLCKENGKWIESSSAEKATQVEFDRDEVMKNHDAVFGKGYRLVRV